MSQLATSSSSELSTSRSRIDTLYRQTYPALVRFLKARLGNQEDAMDVANEAFVRLLRAGYTRIERFTAAMVFTIAGNIAIDQLRQRARRCESQLDDLPACDQLPADAPSPESVYVTECELARALRAIEDLPPKCQRAFVQHWIWSADYAEIAADMQLTESMIRKYVLRAQRHCHGSVCNIFAD